MLAAAYLLIVLKMKQDSVFLSSLELDKGSREFLDSLEPSTGSREFLDSSVEPSTGSREFLDSSEPSTGSNEFLNSLELDTFPNAFKLQFLQNIRLPLVLTWINFVKQRNKLS